MLLLVGFLPWSMTATSAATILLAGITLAEWDFKQKFVLLKKKKPLLLLVLFYTVYALSFLASSYKETALFGLEKKLSFLLFPFIFIGSPPNAEDRKFILHTFVLSTLLACVYCLGYAFYRNYTIGDPATLPYSFAQNFGVYNTGDIYWDYFSYSELARPVRMHPTYLSMYTVFSLIILLQHLVTGVHSGTRKVVQGLGVCLLVSFTLLLSSRIAIITMLLALSFFAFHYYRAHRINKKKGMLTSALVLSAILLLLALPVTRYRLITETAKLFNPKADTDDATGVSQRTVIWGNALSHSQDHWLLGVGLGDVQHLLDQGYKSSGYPNLIGANAHNQYLETLLASGIAGLSILLLLFTYTLVFSLRYRDSISTAFIIILTITCFTESILESNKGIIFTTFFSCLLFSGWRNASDVNKLQTSTQSI